MTVKELKAALEEFDDDDLVVLSRDPEGNGFMPLDECAASVFADGETYPRELDDELRARGFTDDDLYHGKNGKNAAVLWPE